MDNEERADASSSRNVKYLTCKSRGAAGELELEFSDGSSLFVPATIAAEIFAEPGDEIALPELEVLRLRIDSVDAMRYAVDCLGRRDYSAHKLLIKLRQKGFKDEISRAVLDDLRRSSYIDDLRFGTRWVESRLRKRNESTTSLRAGLSRQGLDRETTETVLTSVLPSDFDRQSFRREIIELERKGGMSIQRIARKLSSLGFSAELIHEYIEKINNP